VQATCTQFNVPVNNPMVGCGNCHSPLIFMVDDQGNNDL
jgi:hypothetical protein